VQNTYYFRLFFKWSYCVLAFPVKSKQPNMHHRLKRTAVIILYKLTGIYYF